MEAIAAISDLPEGRGLYGKILIPWGLRQRIRVNEIATRHCFKTRARVKRSDDISVNFSDGIG